MKEVMRKAKFWDKDNPNGHVSGEDVNMDSVTISQTHREVCFLQRKTTKFFEEEKAGGYHNWGKRYSCL